MSKVTTGATMSLDGFIANANHGGFDHLFKWYWAGDVEVPTGHPDMTMRVSAASAEHLRQLNERLGALVVGRRLYDMTNAWGGRHPHPGEPGPVPMAGAGGPARILACPERPPLPD
jgi:hypothetical protein